MFVSQSLLLLPCFMSRPVQQPLLRRQSDTTGPSVLDRQSSLGSGSSSRQSSFSGVSPSTVRQPAAAVPGSTSAPLKSALRTSSTVPQTKEEEEDEDEESEDEDDEEEEEETDDDEDDDEEDANKSGTTGKNQGNYNNHSLINDRSKDYFHTSRGILSSSSSAAAFSSSNNHSNNNNNYASPPRSTAASTTMAGVFGDRERLTNDRSSALNSERSSVASDRSFSDRPSMTNERSSSLYPSSSAYINERPLSASTVLSSASANEPVQQQRRTSQSSFETSTPSIRPTNSSFNIDRHPLPTLTPDNPVASGRRSSTYQYRTRRTTPDDNENPIVDTSPSNSAWTQYLRNKYGNSRVSSDSSSVSRSKSSGAVYSLSKEDAEDDDDDDEDDVPRPFVRRGSRSEKSSDTSPYSAQFSYPRAMYMSKRRIQFKVGSRGTGAGHFTWPRGVAVGPDNIICVADSSNHRVQVFDSNGRFRFEFGSYGTNDGEFDCPAGVAVNRIGQFILSDR